MGLINFGVPEKEVDFFRKILGLDVFVEGGTAKKMNMVFLKKYLRRLVYANTKA